MGKIAIFDNGIPKGVGSLTSSYAIALYIGLLVSFVLGMRRLRFPGGMLVAIIIAAVYCKAQGIIAATPAAKREDMTSLVGELDLISLFTDPKLLPVFIILFVIGFYGSIGKFIGLTASTNLQKNGELEGLKSAMYTQGIGTVTSGLLGTSSVITYVESAVGITTGGRTGLVSIVVGILMLCSLVFTPLVGLIPIEATSGVLCYVGFIMLPHDRWRDSSGAYNTFDVCVAVVMGLISLIFFNLIWAMTFGFIAYTIRQICGIGPKNPFLISSTIILVISTILQEYIK